MRNLHLTPVHFGSQSSIICREALQFQTLLLLMLRFSNCAFPGKMNELSFPKEFTFTTYRERYLRTIDIVSSQQRKLQVRSTKLPISAPFAMPDNFRNHNMETLQSTGGRPNRTKACLSCRAVKTKVRLLIANNLSADPNLLVVR